MAGALRAHRVLMPGFEGTELPDWLERRLRGGLGGVCLFAENIVSATQLRALVSRIRAANPSAVVAIDEEGGEITRLHAADGSPYPSHALLGRIDDAALTEAVAAAIGSRLRALGISLDFAPVADVLSDPDGDVIGARSFGADPARVAVHVAAFVRGLQAAGVAACAKHFPGHGGTADDSHTSLPVVPAAASTLRARDLPPFRAAIDAGARAVMSAHVIVPALDPLEPATMSAPILSAVLRGELGFDGVTVSDALDMAGASGVIGMPEAAVRAFAAGCDLLCLGLRTTEDVLTEVEHALSAAIADERIPAARLAEAAARLEAVGGSLGDAPDAGPLLDGGFELDLDRVIAAFEIAPGTNAVPAAPIVVLDSQPGGAVVEGCWGPVAAGAEAIVVREPREFPAGIVAPVVVGRALHASEWARATIGAARLSPGAVIVEMGVPPAEPIADVHTFDASRLAGRALLRWLERGPVSLDG